MTQLATAERAAPVEAAQPSAPVTDAFLAMIERAARDPAVDIDKMERLFSMRERLTAQAAERAYSEAMAEMQPNLPVVQQNGTITIYAKEDTTRSRAPIQQTKFAKWEDINEAIVPVMRDHGFSLTFGAAKDGDRVVVTGTVRHRDGHKEQTTLSLALDTSGSKNNVQAVGSSISYGKRYCAGLLLNITSRAKGDADDDGQAAGAGEGLGDADVERLRQALQFVDGDEVKFCKVLGVAALADIRPDKFQAALDKINSKGKRQ